MATIKEIIDLGNKSAGEIINTLKEKSIKVPTWAGRNSLQAEYDPKMHPVMNKSIYPDVVNDDGTRDFVTRITYNLQQLAVKRMMELCCGIPVKRVYSAENDTQNEIARYLEKIYQRNRIDSVNNERLTMLFEGVRF